MSHVNQLKAIEIWIEQCWRDVLKIVWGLENDLVEFHKRVPTTAPIMVCFVVAQQFVISRAKVRERPLRVWKKLLQIIAEQPACHLGEPDYENLYAFRSTKNRVGPEPSSIMGSTRKRIRRTHPRRGDGTPGTCRFRRIWS